MMDCRIKIEPRLHPDTLDIVSKVCVQVDADLTQLMLIMDFIAAFLS